MEKKLKKIVIATGCIIAIAIAAWLYRGLTTSHVEMGSDEAIDITPTQIESIKAIGEWEFLSVSDEELVDTVRKGILSDDQLVRIYYGTLRLGINMHQVKPGWLRVEGDTVRMMLPEVGLLDTDFIDEARTKSFFESGSWKAEDREAMYKRAYAKMKAHGLTAENIAIAHDNAKAQMTQLLRTMGYKNIDIKFER